MAVLAHRLAETLLGLADAVLDRVLVQHQPFGGCLVAAPGLQEDQQRVTQPSVMLVVSGQAAAAAILECDLNNQPNDVAAAYARHLAPLQKTLAFSHRAARAFYAQPERGFKAMRLPFMRSLILKTYADGLPHTSLITALAKLV